MFRRVLIPIDGSEFSQKAISGGIALAKMCGATLTAVHVTPPVYVPMRDNSVEYDAAFAARLEQEYRRAGEQYLKRVESAAQAAGVTCAGVLVESRPAWEGIVETAQKQKCDVIVMAAHGRAGIKALVLGSETDKVLTHSKIPVLVYR